MKKVRSIFSLLAVFMVLFLAACGGNESDKAADKKSGDGDKAKTEEFKPYTVEHAMGSTTIEKEPKRVVVLTSEGTEALLALGVTPVGAVEAFTGDPWYEHTSDKLKDTKVVGVESQVNVEAILALKPDLIIGNKMRQEAVYEQLSKIAPTVFAETLRGDWKENFKLYSKAVNKEEEGTKVLADYDKRIEDLKAKLGDKVNMKVSMVRFLAGDVRIYHKDSFSGVILEQIGFARPAEQDKPDFAEKNVTKERIPAMDGDIIFYFTYEEGDGKASQVEKDWINDPLFKNLNAAKAGNVHKVSDVIWNTAGGVLAANIMLDELEEIMTKK